MIMRIRLSWMTVLGAGLLAWPALAQPPEKPADDPPASDSAMKQKLLDNFDTNKDGTIDRSEARAIGRALRENFDIGPGPGGPGGRGPQAGRRSDGPPPEGPPPEGRRGRGQGDGPPAGDRGPRGPRRGEGRGPDGEGPPPPPRPERLFERFDENKDGSLSKEEFMKLSDFVREHRPPGPPPMAWRGGPGRGFDGPPRDGDYDRRDDGGRRRGWRQGPPGPPPGPDGPPADPPGDDGDKEPI
jgi:EF hand